MSKLGICIILLAGLVGTANAQAPLPTQAAPVEIREIKSPETALALSLGITALGYGLAFGERHSPNAQIVGGLLALVGPSTGHLYAGDYWNAGLGIQLAGVGISTVAFFVAIDGADSHTAAPNGSSVPIFLVGGLVYLGGSIYEIATAPRAARDYNRKAAGYKLVPIAAPNAGGVSLVGSF